VQAAPDPVVPPHTPSGVREMIAHAGTISQATSSAPASGPGAGALSPHPELAESTITRQTRIRVMLGWTRNAMGKFQ